MTEQEEQLQMYKYKDVGWLRLDPEDIWVKLVGPGHLDTRNLITLEEAEVKYKINKEDNLWRKLLKQIQDGDELYEYKTSPHSWKCLAGHAGIHLSRNGKYIGGYCTSRN